MRDFKALHPRLQVMATELKEKCAEQGISILFSECVRTKAEQDALYAQGRTTAGKIVTNAKGSTYSSQHQWGIAVDFYINMDVDGDGKKSDDAFNNSTGLFERVGAIAKSIGLGWGGDWTSPKAEYGTPEKFMAAWDNGGKSMDYINTVTGYERTQFICDVQRAIGAKVDGKAGKETIGKTPTVSRKVNKNHPVVTALERRLKALGYYTGTIEVEVGKVPNFGPAMEKAVKAYQKDKFGSCDGEITAKQRTWKSLLGMI